MQENKMGSDYLASTSRHSGIDYNYSVDYMKKASFTDELNNVLIHKENNVEKDIIVEYLKNRVEEITKRYK